MKTPRTLLDLPLIHTWKHKYKVWVTISSEILWKICLLKSVFLAFWSCNQPCYFLEFISFVCLSYSRSWGGVEDFNLFLIQCRTCSRLGSVVIRDILHLLNCSSGCETGPTQGLGMTNLLIQFSMANNLLLMVLWWSVVHIFLFYLFILFVLLLSSEFFFSLKAH